MASILSELRAQRTNLASQLKHIDAALSVFGKLDAERSYPKPRRTLSAAEGKKISSRRKHDGQREYLARSIRRSEIQAHHVGSSLQENRSVSAGKVGESEAAEEGCVKSSA